MKEQLSRAEVELLRSKIRRGETSLSKAREKILVLSWVILIQTIVIILLMLLNYRTLSSTSHLVENPTIETKLIFEEVEVESGEVIDGLKAEVEYLKLENEKLLTLDNSLLGEFEITQYTLREEECGKAEDHPAYGITKSGKYVEEGVTIASDWGVLPEGTKVYIDGIGVRTVHDTGGMVKGKSIDVFTYDLEGAKEWGRQDRKVWILSWGKIK